LFCSLAAIACAPVAGPERYAGSTMGTTYEVLVPRRPGAVSRRETEALIRAVLDEADRHLSGWNPSSELSRFNAQGTEWFPASDVLFEAVAAAQSVSRASGGAFDVTVAPLVRAWGFGAGAARDGGPPADAELETLRASVGYGKLELQSAPPAMRKSEPSLRIDLDGIAPGYAVDRIAARLEALGVRDYLVELGGEVRARGLNASGRPWRVAVEAPLAGERRPYALVELDGVAVSTSGDYRDFREVDGRRVSHTIDPRSGRPAEHRLASVTVVHASCAAADAWATALTVLGPEEGAGLAQRVGLAALFIEREASGALRERVTPAFASLRRPLPPGI
jgi:thiamine biosynthesis lipoprotein